MARAAHISGQALKPRRLRVFYDHCVSTQDSGVTDTYEKGMHQVTGAIRCPHCKAVHPNGHKPRWLQIRTPRFRPWWFERQSPEAVKALIKKWARRWTHGSILVQWTEEPPVWEFGQYHPFFRIAIYHCNASRIQPINEKRPEGFPASVK